MPTVKNEKGEVISKQPYTAEGESRAQDIANANPSWEVDYSPGGTFDGAQRSVTDYAGGGKTGYSKIGMYKEGGGTKGKSDAIFDLTPEGKQARLKRKLEKTTKKHSEAKAEYQKQLDKEEAKDVEKGRKKGTTTKRRKTIAKVARGVIGAGLAASGVGDYKKYKKLGDVGVKTLAKKVLKPISKVIGGVSGATGDLPGQGDATIFEPKRLKAQRLKKKKRILELKVNKKKKKK